MKLKFVYFRCRCPDRQEALCAYDRVCGEVLELVRSGKSVGITAEGDACFYSSAHYMYGQLAQAGFPGCDDRRCTCFLLLPGHLSDCIW